MTWILIGTVGSIAFGLGAFWQFKRGCSECRNRVSLSRSVKSLIAESRRENRVRAPRRVASTRIFSG